MSVKTAIRPSPSKVAKVPSPPYRKTKRRRHLPPVFFLLSSGIAATIRRHPATPATPKRKSQEWGMALAMREGGGTEHPHPILAGQSGRGLQFISEHVATACGCVSKPGPAGSSNASHARITIHQQSSTISLCATAINGFVSSDVHKHRQECRQINPITGMAGAQ